MPAPDMPVHLDEALRALDSLHSNLRGVQELRPFLDALHEMQIPLPPVPTHPLADYVRMEQAYAAGARCLDRDGTLIVIPRAALLELLRSAQESKL